MVNLKMDTAWDVCHFLTKTYILHNELMIGPHFTYCCYQSFHPGVCCYFSPFEDNEFQWNYIDVYGIIWVLNPITPL